MIRVIEWGAGARPSPVWSLAAYGCAAGLASGIGYVILRTPVQISDTLGTLLSVSHMSWRALFASQLVPGAYFRPFFAAHQKALLELSGGAYTIVFRTYHALQLAIVLFAFVHLLRVRRAEQFAAAAFALTVLLGIHTTNGLVREAFPVNTGLTIVACCLLALDIARRATSAWWTDAAAVLAFVIAAGTAETGLLVWVGVVAARIVGWRGVSASALSVMTLLLGGYLTLRFALVGTLPGAASLRPTGFGFGTVDVEWIRTHWGANLLMFYAYNVGASVLTVLFSEPRHGVWIAVRDIGAGHPGASTVVNLFTSTLTTSLIAWAVISGAARWRAWRLSDGDRLIAVFAAMLVANAAISFAYTRDVTMSPAGTLYAAAACVGLAEFLTHVPRRPGRYAVASAMLFALSIGWSIRAVSIPDMLVHAAWDERAVWADVDAWLARQGIALTTPRARGIVQVLRKDAMDRPMPVPFAELTPLPTLVDHDF